MTLLSLAAAIAVTVISQVSAYDIPPAPQVQYRFITTVEENTPIATCDSQFNCHCPAGYRASISQSSASVAATAVTCIPVNSASKQLRETFDSYPILPSHENFGK